ncbi:hypoxanthine phosphoribosyltransferase [Hymenobacter sp. DG25A]|uniref:hypoxanthine phosphoribosyltransferase n=1 Tax=Hymenobacter sp. DG25A TaxID=1385663 RepID=UPI0009E77A16|nr:hypoxanthine phosphoribosyltransferase [Hymenobacter sp. DG25A]
MPLSTISLHDKEFSPYLSANELSTAIRLLAQRLNEEYANRQPLFVAVLNGSFMFAADLLKEITIPCEITFIRVASYEGTGSTGHIQQVLGLREEVKERHVVLLEDIVDTGNTMQLLLEQFNKQEPASLEVATLFMKPECLLHDLHIRYVGLSIPNDFIVGYGLDYDGLGRNYPDVYKAV